MEVTESPMGSYDKLVHLDLKGAPPKISYFEKIFPLLRQWGATGLLVEYEDMFPYSGPLQEIAAPHVYSANDISRLLSLAAAHHLEVIPLIQTIGHFEFVLKHDRWWGLREVAEYPFTLCPLNTGSLELVAAMLDQVLALHPQMTALHIGADEVHHLGSCPTCNEHMKVNKLTPVQMFLQYVCKVLQYVRGKHTSLRLLMWDDMFREADLATIANSGIGELVEPMVWHYQNVFNLPLDIWERYSCVFSSMWVASAYKGATGPCLFATDIGYHVENHRGWQALEPVLKHKFSSFKGYALTGWQRYDHYSVLCELLPVGLPSLAVCLLMLQFGAFTEEVHHIASTDLGFKERLPLVPFHSVGEVSECSFPGSAIYQHTQRLLALSNSYRMFIANDRLNGWMSPYHIRHKFCNPGHIHFFLPQAQQMLQTLADLRQELEQSLGEVFFPDTVDEFLCVNMDEMVNKLRTIVNDATSLLTHGARVKTSSTENAAMVTREANDIAEKLCDKAILHSK